MQRMRRHMLDWIKHLKPHDSHRCLSLFIPLSTRWDALNVTRNVMITTISYRTRTARQWTGHRDWNSAPWCSPGLRININNRNLAKLSLEIFTWKKKSFKKIIALKSDSYKLHLKKQFVVNLHFFCTWILLGKKYLYDLFKASKKRHLCWIPL